MQIFFFYRLMNRESYLPTSPSVAAKRGRKRLFELRPSELPGGKLVIFELSGGLGGERG